jgi:DNA-binding NtrC family response regulator
VRELQNVIERAVLLAKDKQIEPIDLPFDNGTLPEGTSSNVTWDVPPNMTLEDIERLVIERTLQRTGGTSRQRPISWESTGRALTARSGSTISTCRRSSRIIASWHEERIKEH